MNISKSLFVTLSLSLMPMQCIFAQSFSIESIDQKPIPKFTFPLLNSETYSTTYDMEDYPNGVFVFEAYRSSCGACSDNSKNLNQLTIDYKDNARVQILDLSLDKTEAEFEDWIARNEPNHHVIHDVELKAYKAMRKTGGVPQVFVVDCKGNLVGNLEGVWDADQYDKVKRLIKFGLDTSCSE